MENTELSSNYDANLSPVEGVQNLNNFFKCNQSTDLSDEIEFKIDSKIIKAQKSVLAAKNEVFRKMFTFNIKQSSNNIWEITDTDLKTFDKFLKYLYSSEILDEDLNIHMLLLAKKYLDANLKSMCEKNLCRNTNVENAVEHLLVSFKTASERLKNLACTFIVQNYVEIQLLPNFQYIRSNIEALNTISAQFSKLFSSTCFILLKKNCLF